MDSHEENSAVETVPVFGNEDVNVGVIGWGDEEFERDVVIDKQGVSVRPAMNA